MDKKSYICTLKYGCILLLNPFQIVSLSTS